MKNLFQLLLVSALLILGITTNVNAQSNCYEEYKKLFTERGATAIPDGTHEVVLTVRDDDNADCYLAKVQVASNQIVKVLGILLEDGTVKPLEGKLASRYTSEKNPTSLSREIKNGMSSTILTDEDKLINIFFIKQLKQKTDVFKKAPSVDSL